MTPIELVNEYIADHVLREASKSAYLAAARAAGRYFTPEVDVLTIERRKVLAWRQQVLDDGLSKRSWNTYSSHLRTIWTYAIEEGLLPKDLPNPFKKTAVQPPKRKSKTVERDAITRAREWLYCLMEAEEVTGSRASITPAWFWLAVFEMFYYTGIRLNALLCVRLEDINLQEGLIRVCGNTEKTHREYFVPITEGLEPHIRKLVVTARRLGFKPRQQLFNVNRFSTHYYGEKMNIDQIEGMYRKLTKALGVRMTPHRFRHTLATDLMKQPERNIHLTKSLLNHSNLATTMSYIEVDYEHMREVLHERSVAQGAWEQIGYVEEAPYLQASEQLRLEYQPRAMVHIPTGLTPGPRPERGGFMPLQPAYARPDLEHASPPIEQFQRSALYTLMASQLRAMGRRERPGGTFRSPPFGRGS